MYSINKNTVFELLSGWPPLEQLQQLRFMPILTIKKKKKKNNLDHTVGLEMAQIKITRINQIPYNNRVLMVIFK